MSIKSTSTITRDSAIARIKIVVQCIESKNYRFLEEHSFEDNYNTQKFIDQGTKVDISHIDNWSRRMLEETMDCPFYRNSMFDNYFVLEEGDD
jgi:hypothetical protein